MATRFTDAQVASYIQNNALSGAGLQQAAQVFQLPADQIARAQSLLTRNDPSIAAASQAYEAAVAGRPDLVAENLAFYNPATGTGSGSTVAAGGGGAATSTRPTFGTAIETQLYNFLQQPNLTDAQIAAEAKRLGATAQQISNVTGVPVGQINTRVQTANYTPAEMGFFNFLQTPGLTDAQILAEANRVGFLPQQVANITGLSLAEAQNRFFTEFLRTPGLTDADIAAERARLGISNEQISQITGVPVGTVTNRVNAAFPFANAGVPSNMGTYTPPPAGSRTPATFAENFNNYVSIPIGAQYNPNVTAGGASPYSQIRPQLQPVGNPYADIVGGRFMGGYDPSIYDQNLLSNFVAQRAADEAAARGEAIAAQQAAEYGAYKGGLITKVMGPKPPTPDDGTMFVQKGEYIVKKDAVNKYGKGLLDMVNEGKVPAAKMKSLLK